MFTALSLPLVAFRFEAKKPGNLRSGIQRPLANRGTDRVAPNAEACADGRSRIGTLAKRLAEQEADVVLAGFERVAPREFVAHELRAVNACPVWHTQIHRLGIYLHMPILLKLIYTLFVDRDGGCSGESLNIAE